MRAVLAKPVNLTIKTGITLSGNRNTVYFESGSDHDDGAASKILAKACGGMETVVAERVCEEGIAGRKRRAVSVSSLFSPSVWVVIVIGWELMLIGLVI